MSFLEPLISTNMEILTQDISCSKGARVLTQLKCLENVSIFFNQHESV